MYSDIKCTKEDGDNPLLIVTDAPNTECRFIWKDGRRGGGG